MTFNLVFLKFNNYYNRRIKRYETVPEYTTKYPYFTDNRVRTIDYNDGINISITVNKQQTFNSLEFNYILALNSSTDEIDSRWFILEERQTRQGQWILNLRRDLVADFYDKFLESTVYVEKGRLTDDIIDINSINPLIFNQEQFTANQIKKSEYLLKDKLGCKWIVGYLNKGSYPTDTNIQTHTNLLKAPDVTVSTASDLAWLNKYTTSVVRYPKDLTASFKYLQRNGLVSDKVFQVNVSKDSNSFAELSGGRAYVTSPLHPSYNYEGKYLDQNNYNEMFNYIFTKFNNTAGISEWTRVLGLNNKNILVSDTNKTYRCIVTREGSEYTHNVGVNQSTDAIWYNNLKSYALRGTNVTVSDSNDIFTVKITLSQGLSVKLVDLGSESFNTVIPATRNKTLGESFDAFAIPYVDGEAIGLHLEEMHLGDINDYKGALAIAQEICDVSNATLDLQLVPYCPLEDTLVTSSVMPGVEHTSTHMLTIVKDQINILATPIRDSSNAVKNAVFWLSTTEFSRILQYTDNTVYDSADDIKAVNQLDTWRISSGDYSSSFEFNMARNGGVQYFEVDCKYKPYQPYIHISPNFSGLYGQDFDDTRGLVCSNTDYSLPRLTDQWESYERNNINYRNAFNRQIQNMDTQRKYQKAQEVVSTLAGGLTGVASGSMMGSLIAPGAGIIGGAIGGAASLAGGAYDLYASEQLYKENKQYTIDQFNMSLENIQALPNTLVAAGALNPNNKVFPVLEYYSCSDVERQAFLQKLKWNGFTIGVITDNPKLYIDLAKDSYFKGQLIHIDLDEAAHEASELANELAKGIIFEKE